MDGVAMKKLLIRLSVVSGIVVAVLVSIAAAKKLGGAKSAEAAASQGSNEQPAGGEGPGDFAGANAASEETTAATERTPLKDPFQSPPSQVAYEPQDYYAEAENQPQPAENANQYTETSLTDAPSASETTDAQFTEPERYSVAQPSDDDQQPDGAIDQTESAFEIDEQTNDSAPDNAPDEFATERQTEVENFDQDVNAAAAPKAVEYGESALMPTDDPLPTADRFTPVEEHEQPQPPRAQQPAADARQAGSEKYIEERYPVESENAPVADDGAAESGSPSQRKPVHSAVESAGVPGDPKLETEQGAALVIHKTGPPEVQLGLETVYEIRVQNVGDAPAHEVEIRDVAPRGADLVATQPQIDPGPRGELTWPIGTLAPGDEATVEMRVIPRTEGEIGSVARVVFSAEAAARTLVTKPVLELSVEAPKSVLAGERAQLFVRVTNTGTGVATGVVLEEVVPPSFQHPAGATLEYRIGTLKPRDSRELPLTLAAIRPADVTNIVTARADGDIQVEDRTKMSIIAPALQIAMQGPRRRFLDRDATYTVAVSNPGTAPAQEIELVTFLAEGMEFVSADNAGQYDPQTRAVYWLLDELPPNEMGNVTVTARPTKPGEHVLRVEGRAQRGLEAVDEQPIVVEGLAAVEFQVIDLADPVEINGEAAYEIVVKNGGTKASDAVELNIVLPVEMQLVSADGPTRYKADGQKIAFEPLKSLAPGTTVSFQLTAKTVDSGDARLQVKLITAEMQSPVTKEENTKVFGDE